MKKKEKNPMTFTLGIVAIIAGVALYKQYDPETGSFEKPALAVVYLIVFLAAAIILIKNLVQKKR